MPVVPPTFYCVGLNYAEHVRQTAAKLGIVADLPKQPDVGYRAVNALVAHEEPVVIPADARQVQYEGELARGLEGAVLPGGARPARKLRRVAILLRRHAPDAGSPSD